MSLRRPDQVRDNVTASQAAVLQGACAPLDWEEWSEHEAARTALAPQSIDVRRRRERTNWASWPLALLR